MHIWEILLISIGVSLNVFALTVCWGAMLQKIHVTWLALAALIIGAWQGLVFLAGHYLIQLPFMDETNGYVLTELGRGLTITILIGLGAYMLFKSYRVVDILERRREKVYKYRDALALSALSSVNAFLIGLGLAFMGTELLMSLICFVVITMLAVVIGIYMGYWLGCDKRQIALKIGGAVLMVSGLEVLVSSIIR